MFFLAQSNIFLNHSTGHLNACASVLIREAKPKCINPISIQTMNSRPQLSGPVRGVLLSTARIRFDSGSFQEGDNVMRFSSLFFCMNKDLKSEEWWAETRHQMEWTGVGLVKHWRVLHAVVRLGSLQFILKVEVETFLCRERKEKTSFYAAMFDMIGEIVFKILAFQENKIILYMKHTTCAAKILPQNVPSSDQQ